MVKAYCPIFAEELTDVWNESMLVPVCEFVQISNGQAYKRHERLHHDLFIPKIRHRIDKLVVIDLETQVVSSEVFDVVR